MTSSVVAEVLSVRRIQGVVSPFDLLALPASIVVPVEG